MITSRQIGAIIIIIVGITLILKAKRKKSTKN